MEPALVMAFASPLLDAALAVLADGKARSPDQILAEAVKRGFLDYNRTSKNLYTALTQSIQRALGRGNKPLFVEEIDHSFRLNRPMDDWPAIDTTGLPPVAVASELVPAAAAIIAALKTAADGKDYDAFERTTCKAFELYGFAATHLGGPSSPDGYADALLGELRYRVVIECKLTRDAELAHLSAAAEVAKYRDIYDADCCALVAPSFEAGATFVSELHEHGVAAWTVDDFARAAMLRIDCSQMRELFTPGYAAAGLDDLAWTQTHGSAKRLRVVASWLVEIGLTQQRMALALTHGTPAPRLSGDVALSMIDERLTAAGSTNGVTREEIDAAFTWLTSPYVNRAIWTDDSRTAIVVRPSTGSG